MRVLLRVLKFDNQKYPHGARMIPASDRGINRGINKLTDAAIKRFVAKAKPGQKLADGGGLYLFLTPSGTPTWRIDYRIHDAGKGRVVGRTYSIGVYPEPVTLARARDARADVKKLLNDGRDPMVAKLVQRAATAVAIGTTFGDVTRAWLKQRRPEWSAIHYDKSERALERDVLPYLGNLPVGEITSPMLGAVVTRVVDRGADETAGRILQHVRDILKLAKANGASFAENPAVAASAVLPRRKPAKRRAALHDMAELGAVLRHVERANASTAVKVAHKLVAYAPGSRLGNVVTAKWQEFDLDGDGEATWTIPRQSMKVKAGRGFDHRIILGPTIAELLRQWRRMTQGRATDYVFPSPTGNDKPISREGLEKLYRVTLKDEIGGRQMLHGWRSSFSTAARERGFSKDAVELALDHVADDDVVRAYDRGQRFDERVRLANWWDGELSRAERESSPTTGILPIERHARAG